MQKIEFSSLRSHSRYVISCVLNYNKKYNVHIEKYGSLSGCYCGTHTLFYNLDFQPILSHIADTINLNNINFQIY